MTYFLRLDDACEKRNIAQWDRIEQLLDTHSIKPLVGIIPHCEDPMMDQYGTDEAFWNRVKSWISKGWTPALHGFNHVYITNDGGVNPVNKRSEFAGVSLDLQKAKISNGVDIFRSHGINPQVFFAPSHTFDENTIEALKECSDIRFISDTIANKPYKKWDITFIPQQSGTVRKLPFNTVTFCYHPNTMKKSDFDKLDAFIKQNRNTFKDYQLVPTDRSYSFYDAVLRNIYFAKRF